MEDLWENNKGLGDDEDVGDGDETDLLGRAKASSSSSLPSAVGSINEATESAKVRANEYDDEAVRNVSVNSSLSSADDEPPRQHHEHHQEDSSRYGQRSDAIEEEEEGEQDEPASWLGNWDLGVMDRIMDSTEWVVSETAEVIRDGFATTLSQTAVAFGETDFYRRHMTYTPEDTVTPPARPSSSTAPSSSSLGDSPASTSTTSTTARNAKSKDASRTRSPFVVSTATQATARRAKLAAAAAAASQTGSLANGPTRRAMSNATSTNTSAQTRATPEANDDEQHDNDIEDDEARREEAECNAYLQRIKTLSEVTTAPLAERIRSAGQSIGYINVRLGNTQKLSVDGSGDDEHTKPYVKMSLGPFQSWTSPIAKPRKPRMGPLNWGEYDFSEHALTFVAQDVAADLCIEVRQKNILLADNIIGKVIVPISSILPKVRDALKHKRHAPYTVSAWYEIFALQDPERRKFTPASHDIAKTGMTKAPEPGLGFLWLDIELQLHGRVSMWAGYALPPLKYFSVVPHRPMPSGDLKALAAVDETGRAFKQNFQRVRLACARLCSNGEDFTWVPIRFARYARTGNDMRATSAMVIFVTYACVLSPAWMLPLNAFAVLLASAMTCYGKEERAYLVWNHDIQDPDDLLGPIQRVAKVVYLLEKFNRWFGISADALERAVNTFNFSDERVTIAALLFVGAASFAASLALCFIGMGWLCYCTFWIWLFQSQRSQNANHLGSPRNNSNNNVNAGRSQRAHSFELAITEEEDRGLRSDGIIAQGRAVAKLAIRAPKLARNVFARVPTEEELGHRWIANLQRARGGITSLAQPNAMNTSTPLNQQDSSDVVASTPPPAALANETDDEFWFLQEM